MKLLEVKNLKMYYQISQGVVKAVDDVSFEIEKGEAVGLVGESACGKTSTAMTIMKLLPPNARIVGGQILFKGEDLVPKSDLEMRRIRWKGISMIFQAAMNALNPVHRVGDQVLEAILSHQEISQAEAEKRVEELYHLVGMDPALAKGYPHEYSGGMKQRAVIAMALACNPDLIIADEPTTALDVIVQDQILREMTSLQKRLGMTMIYISHDISVIAETCNRIGVMYGGKLVEYADSNILFESPRHPYTQGLFASYPSLTGEVKKLRPIPGEPPNLLSPPSGCRFHPRCPLRDDICEKEEPAYEVVAERHYVACHFARGVKKE
ncbi:MAG: ABC transporter ATP-binding protein [Candidatus Tectomicrobia bacterium]|nr:ABC transporter ATP-binding protein [Candidatus Tectomicrobia bacterium]